MSSGLTRDLRFPPAGNSLEIMRGDFCFGEEGSSYPIGYREVMKFSWISYRGGSGKRSLNPIFPLKNIVNESNKELRYDTNIFHHQKFTSSDPPSFSLTS